jgi:hypothetical protein
MVVKLTEMSLIVMFQNILNLLLNLIVVFVNREIVKIEVFEAELIIMSPLVVVVIVVERLLDEAALQLDVGFPRIENLGDALLHVLQCAKSPAHLDVFLDHQQGVTRGRRSEESLVPRGDSQDHQ